MVVLESSDKDSKVLTEREKLGFFARGLTMGMSQIPEKTIGANRDFQPDTQTM
jgi:hypothetical protein